MRTRDDPRVHTAELAIETTQLTKHYGAQRGVVDLDLEVRAGEVFGFLGPNGAGKSTTMNLLMGQIGPTAGRSSVLGFDSWSQREAVQRTVGFLPGEFALYERLTGAEMLDFLARLRGSHDRRLRDKLVERFSVELDRPIGTLSMGNRQKLGLVQALAHRPALVVLDEPTLGLDPLVQREFQAVLREARDEGRTVFLSSHTLSEVERVADRVGIIREGRLVEVAEVARLAEMAVRRIDFQFALPVPADVFAGIAGVTQSEVSGDTARVEVEGPLVQVMKVAADREIVNLHVHEADLEDVFLGYYRGDTEGVPR